ncbi:MULTISPECIES: endo alpha-1,4 polygalactosaminidase [Vibrio]|uniref:endo alpha-1,4 polygalactosaminidase n=1 Tax=Vibrio TaxID=662 RepID=UPI001CDCDEB4|nr:MULTISPECIES: endo alpha-1,4 polygalactosaminidase [Vibrio]MCA2422596.1 endo alpha-1,4 polygalactosaminidase [Vibrio alginolyticus]MCA2447243.1 endo alpha-1,4 polygalactosaminidase [Vibrio alginolyticus]MDW2157243.1 endo alpha-1,4 polygalactosaminidase [Vibrio sp. 1942]MDW2183246.1 endo alpha-1,4 polygalactosaminidase [Vibrio sp. 1762]MDW2226907.1 endo alpha-1,4 polygalactosaminidase [Vibrio sp. 1761]
MKLIEQYSKDITFAVVISLTLLTACDSGKIETDPPSPENPSVVDPPPIEPPPVEPPEMWVPTPGSRWMWQLQNYGDMTIDPNIGIYDIDLFDGIEGGTNSLIMKLKNAGKKVICYFSAGTRENWRPDADQFTPDSVIADGDMQDWPGETWLNIGNEQALNDTIKPIMAARLDLAKNNGCDAVEPDNVDGFDNTDETHGLITPEHQLSYNKWLAKEAHARSLSIALKNDIDQLNDLVSSFDFAINEQCYAYSNECQSYEITFLNNNKAVFNQEYYTSGKSGETDLNTYKNLACPYFISVKISSLWKMSYELDGVGVMTCDQ